jgi:glyoxylase-like metal-dependent hydrolase (beta-lactamase superfamily II)
MPAYKLTVVTTGNRVLAMDPPHAVVISTGLETPWPAILEALAEAGEETACYQKAFRLDT